MAILRGLQPLRADGRTCGSPRQHDEVPHRLDSIACLHAFRYQRFASYPELPVNRRTSSRWPDAFAGSPMTDVMPRLKWLPAITG